MESKSERDYRILPRLFPDDTQAKHYPEPKYAVFGATALKAAGISQKFQSSTYIPGRLHQQIHPRCLFQDFNINSRQAEAVLLAMVQYYNSRNGLGQDLCENEYAGGMIISDGTGMGKTREIAAIALSSIIMESYMEKQQHPDRLRRPPLYLLVTLSPDLFNDCIQGFREVLTGPSDPYASRVVFQANNTGCSFINKLNMERDYIQFMMLKDLLNNVGQVLVGDKLVQANTKLVMDEYHGEGDGNTVYEDEKLEDEEEEADKAVDANDDAKQQQQDRWEPHIFDVAKLQLPTVVFTTYNEIRIKLLPMLNYFSYNPPTMVLSDEFHKVCNISENLKSIIRDRDELEIVAEAKEMNANMVEDYELGDIGDLKDPIHLLRELFELGGSKGRKKGNKNNIKSNHFNTYLPQPPGSIKYISPRIYPKTDLGMSDSFRIMIDYLKVPSYTLFVSATPFRSNDDLHVVDHLLKNIIKSYKVFELALQSTSGCNIVEKGTCNSNNNGNINTSAEEFSTLFLEMAIKLLQNNGMFLSRSLAPNDIKYSVVNVPTPPMARYMLDQLGIYVGEMYKSHKCAKFHMNAYNDKLNDIMMRHNAHTRNKKYTSCKQEELEQMQVENTMRQEIRELTRKFNTSHPHHNLVWFKSPVMYSSRFNGDNNNTNNTIKKQKTIAQASDSEFALPPPPSKHNHPPLDYGESYENEDDTDIVDYSDISSTSSTGYRRLKQGVTKGGDGVNELFIPCLQRPVFPHSVYFKKTQQIGMNIKASAVSVSRSVYLSMKSKTTCRTIDCLKRSDIPYKFIVAVEETGGSFADNMRHHFNENIKEATKALKTNKKLPHFILNTNKITDNEVFGVGPTEVRLESVIEDFPIDGSSDDGEDVNYGTTTTKKRKLSVTRKTTAAASKKAKTKLATSDTNTNNVFVHTMGMFDRSPTSRLIAAAYMSAMKSLMMKTATRALEGLIKDEMWCWMLVPRLPEYNVMQLIGNNYIDDVQQRLGQGECTEITNRKNNIRITKHGFVRVCANQMTRDPIKALNDFNNTERVKTILIGKKASTGFNLHDSENNKVPGTRAHIVAQLPLSAKSFLQGLGRSNRTGQVTEPIYFLLIFGNKEQRFVRSLHNRVKNTMAGVHGDRYLNNNVKTGYNDNDDDNSNFLERATEQRIIGYTICLLAGLITPVNVFTHSMKCLKRSGTRLLPLESCLNNPLLDSFVLCAMDAIDFWSLSPDQVNLQAIINDDAQRQRLAYLLCMRPSEVPRTIIRVIEAFGSYVDSTIFEHYLHTDSNYEIGQRIVNLVTKIMVPIYANHYGGSKLNWEDQTNLGYYHYTIFRSAVYNLFNGGSYLLTALVADYSVHRIKSTVWTKRNIYETSLKLRQHEPCQPDFQNKPPMSLSNETALSDSINLRGEVIADMTLSTSALPSTFTLSSLSASSSNNALVVDGNFLVTGLNFVNHLVSTDPRLFNRIMNSLCPYKRYKIVEDMGNGVKEITFTHVSCLESAGKTLQSGNMTFLQYNNFKMILNTQVQAVLSDLQHSVEDWLCNSTGDWFKRMCYLRKSSYFMGQYVLNDKEFNPENIDIIRERANNNDLGGTKLVSRNVHRDEYNSNYYRNNQSSGGGRDGSFYRITCKVWADDWDEPRFVVLTPENSKFVRCYIDVFLQTILFPNNDMVRVVIPNGRKIGLPDNVFVKSECLFK